MTIGMKFVERSRIALCVSVCVCVCVSIFAYVCLCPIVSTTKIFDRFSQKLV